MDYCYDRRVPDSRGRIICGHTLKDGDKVVIVDDLMSTGQTICKRVERLKEVANIDVIAVVVIADLTDDEAREQGLGAQMLEEKYGAKTFSIIKDKDVKKFMESNR